METPTDQTNPTDDTGPDSCGCCITPREDDVPGDLGCELRRRQGLQIRWATFGTEQVLVAGSLLEALENRD